jgi:hypothetical protein
VAGTEKAAEVNTIAEGTWTVGTDIQPGQTRTVKAITADAGCYWEINKSGTNGADIVANDKVTGGRPTVTLKVGQDFTTTGRGGWAKVGQVQ